jgi:hypothetical protein
MRILTDENIFKSSYFKNICPGYEQFFEPEKLFLRLTDDAAEIKRRQNILCDLIGNSELFEDLCFLSEAIMQFKTAFDDMPNHDLGDFRLNLERFNDADGAFGLLDKFLKAADYAEQYPWLNDLAKGVKALSEKRSIEMAVAAWEQAYIPEEHMRACDFGFFYFFHRHKTPPNNDYMTVLVIIIALFISFTMLKYYKFLPIRQKHFVIMFNARKKSRGNAPASEAYIQFCIMPELLMRQMMALISARVMLLSGW